MNLFVKHNQNNKGQTVILTVIFFLIISTAVISAVVIPTSNQVKSVNDLMRAKQGYVASDAVASDAWYRLGLGKTLPSTMTLPFSTPVSTSASITSSASQITIDSSGVDGSTVRHARSVFVKDSSLDFSYALAVGTGGISLGGGSNVTGNVYSNGNITSDSSNSYVSGSATAANDTPPIIDQSNGYDDNTLPIPIIIGDNSTEEDIAQSFVAGSSVGLTYIRFYVRKIGYIGSNSTVRIVNDNSGKPGKTTYASGTLKASTVTTSFTYVTVPISGAPTLTPGTTYWLVVDKPNNQSWAYYEFAGTANGYINGVAKRGKWSNSNGGTTWIDLPVSNTDMYFDIYVGGSPSTISGGGQYSPILIGNSGSGSAWAFQLNSVSVKDDAFCEFGSYLYDLNNNEKTCDVSRGAPATAALPITQSMIDLWKDNADAFVSNGSVSIGGGVSTSTGPMKIVGNLSVTGGSNLYVTGPIWVTGNLSVGGGSVVRVPSSLGSQGGIIVVGGTVSVTGGGVLRGSGTNGSYLMVVSESSSNNAIAVEGGAGSVILIALNGTVNISGGGTANNVIAKQFNMTGGSHVIYDDTLSDLNFEGVTASDWKISSWGEVSE